MAFCLNSVVPWGRNLSEYKRMFDLSDADLDLNIASFGDGPASFNSEMTKRGKRVTSFDPIYQLIKDEIASRIKETKQIVLEQTEQNSALFNWSFIKNIVQLEQLRMNAMHNFLLDFEAGVKQGRYVNHKLPKVLPDNDRKFDLALSSHFLLLYDELGVEFHMNSITEIMRVSNELRVFPIVNLNAQESKVLKPIMKHFNCRLENVDYEFQKGANRMLVIRN